MGYIAVAIAPCIAICMFFFYRDVFNREPSKDLLISFILGCASVLFALFFQDTLGLFAYSIDGSVTGVFVASYLVVALSEESGKFIGLRYFSYRQKSFDEPFDGIVHAVMISMGFAMVENIKYVTQLAKPGEEYEMGLARMFTAVPAHATFAIIMGYFVGKAKFDKVNNFKLLFMGLLGAVFFHGTYDFFLFLVQFSFVGVQEGNQYLAGGALVSFVISLILCRKLIKQHRKLSRQMFKPENTTRSA